MECEIWQRAFWYIKWRQEALSRARSMQQAGTRAWNKSHALVWSTTGEAVPPVKEPKFANGLAKIPFCKAPKFSYGGVGKKMERSSGGGADSESVLAE